MGLDNLRLENIGPVEKANILEAAIARAESDIDYAITVAWGDDKNEIVMNAKIAIKNTRELFQSGRIDTLEYNERAQAYANYNALLDSLLRKFPEYAVENDMFKPKAL